MTRPPTSTELSTVAYRAIRTNGVGRAALLVAVANFAAFAIPLIAKTAAGAGATLALLRAFLILSAMATTIALAVGVAKALVGSSSIWSSTDGLFRTFIGSGLGLLIGTVACVPAALAVPLTTDPLYLRLGAAGLVSIGASRFGLFPFFIPERCSYLAAARRSWTASKPLQWHLVLVTLVVSGVPEFFGVVVGPIAAVSASVLVTPIWFLIFAAAHHIVTSTPRTEVANLAERSPG